MNWNLAAKQSLRDFIEIYPKRKFIAPEVREWSELRGLPAPASNYSWGGVFLSAKNEGLITHAGYADYGDATMHTQSVRVWRAV